MKRHLKHLLLPALVLLAGCTRPAAYDVIIRNGTVYDGSGSPPVQADVAISGDRIAAVGSIAGEARVVIDAGGRAVAPGFINMLSWATDSLIHDGQSQSEIRQGVTLEVMGEGMSMGPWNDEMKKEDLQLQGDIKYDIPWTTLGEYLEHLEKKGVATNVASFVGATTVRIHELGYANRAPTAAELDRMQALVRTAMEEGALGVGSALIYAPAFYAKTDELVALAREAGRYRRHVHLAHAERGRSAAGGAGRADSRRPRGEGSRGDLPPQGGRPTELAEDGSGDWQDRGRAPDRALDYRRHVHVHGRRHRPRRGDAAVGAGGRTATSGSSA